MQRLLCPWNSLGKNTGVGCHPLLQGICPTQGSNSGLLHYRQILYHLSHHRCERWTIKKAECWRIDAFELWCWRKLLSPLDSKEIKPVNPKGNQPWIFNGGTDAEAKAPMLWPPDGKSWLTGKDPMLGKLRAGEGDNRWLHGLNVIIDSKDMSLRKLWEKWRTWKLGVLHSRVSQRVRYDWATEQQMSLALFCWLY